MTLTAEQVAKNWEVLISYIDKYVSSPRKEQLIEFYENHSARISLMPASHKKEYHNSFPGGYVDHVVRVTSASLHLYDLWVKFGMDTSTFTEEELVFSAVNHDLGKIGSEEEESYIPQTDQWRKEKLGEDYTFNPKVPFASVPDRGLFLLQAHGIKYTFNEMIAIQTHDGLWDEANKKYLISFSPEQKFRTSLPYIIHQADILASRVEFEREWLPKFKKEKNSSVENPKDKFKLKTPSSTQGKPEDIKSKALKNLKNPALQDLLNNL